jgi:hypothetical protein
MKWPQSVQIPGLDTMGLVLAVWICTLPFIGLLIAPIFGAQTAITVAIASLIMMLITCWGRCMLNIVRLFADRIKLLQAFRKS